MIQHQIFLCKPDFLKIAKRKKTEGRVKVSEKERKGFLWRLTSSRETGKAEHLEKLQGEKPEQLGKAKKAYASMNQLDEQLRYKSRNIFLSAPGGYGKTHILTNALRPVLEDRYGETEMWVTATTGIAAIDIEGYTIHSQSSLQRGYGAAISLIEDMKLVQKNRWLKVKVIVIDEISMMGAPFLNLLDEVGRIIRKSKLPFGGVRLIVVGDFGQLPPIGELVRIKGSEAAGVKYKRQPIQYAFEAEAWKASKFLCYRPIHCWRYDINSRIGIFLQSLRLASTVTMEIYTELKDLLRKNEPKLETSSILCSKKAAAAEYSVARLKALEGEEETYFGKGD